MSLSLSIQEEKRVLVITISYSGGGGGGGGRKEWRGVEGRDRSLTCNELPTSNILLARDIRISSGSMGRAVNKFES